MNLRNLVFVAILLSVVAYAQQDGYYQVRYASNLDPTGVAGGDSFINISNDGFLPTTGIGSGTAATVGGSICVNVYAFDPTEEIVSCCSCPATPDGLVSLSVLNDLVANHLGRATPTSLMIKLTATLPTAAGSCANQAANQAVVFVPGGMVAWGTTLHKGPGGVFQTTETPFTNATLSFPGEFTRLTTLCNFALVQGTGFGICNTCKVGGLGAAAQ